MPLAALKRPPLVIRSLTDPLPKALSFRPVGHSLAREAVEGVPLGDLPPGLVEGTGIVRGHPIKIFRSPPSAVRAHPFAVQDVQEAQIALLDPSGARTRFFAGDNPEGPMPGDILHMTFKGTTAPFSGVLLAIRRAKHETAILLRNEITRVAVEMWHKIYSPNIASIEIVQRRQEYHDRGKRARRAKLYFMRQPKHDLRSVDNTVLQFLRAKKGAQEVVKIGGKQSKKKK